MKVKFLSFSRALCCLLLVISLPMVQAQETPSYQDPYLMIQTISADTFERFALEQDQLQNDPEYLRQIIQQNLMPYIDKRYAAFKILGPALRTVTAEQRDQFTEAFSHYMVATFVHAFNDYTGQTIEIEASQSTGTRNIVGINGRIISADQPPIAVQFRARRNKRDQTWLAIDIVVEGVSLLGSKESEIGALIRRHGVDEVIQMMMEQSLTQDLTEQSS